MFLAHLSVHSLKNIYKYVQMHKSWMSWGAYLRMEEKIRILFLLHH